MSNIATLPNNFKGSLTKINLGLKSEGGVNHLHLLVESTLYRHA